MTTVKGPCFSLLEAVRAWVPDDDMGILSISWDLADENSICPGGMAFVVELDGVSEPVRGYVSMHTADPDKISERIRNLLAPVIDAARAREMPGTCPKCEKNFMGYLTRGVMAYGVCPDCGVVGGPLQTVAGQMFLEQRGNGYSMWLTKITGWRFVTRDWDAKPTWDRRKPPLGPFLDSVLESVGLSREIVAVSIEKEGPP